MEQFQHGSETVSSLQQRGGKRNKHLIFALRDMVFGIPLSQVKEIIGMVNVTAVPEAPTYYNSTPQKTS